VHWYACVYICIQLHSIKFTSICSFLNKVETNPRYFNHRVNRCHNGPIEFVLKLEQVKFYMKYERWWKETHLQRRINTLSLRKKIHPSWWRTECRHRDTCSSKPGAGGIVFVFWPFSVSCYFSLGFGGSVIVHFVYRLGNSKAAAHVAVDLQCWFTLKHVKNDEKKEEVIPDVSI